MDETTIMHAHRQSGRIVYAAEDPFPAPRPFQRSSYSSRRKVRRGMRRRPLRGQHASGTICMVAAVALVVVALAGVLGVASTLQSDLRSQADGGGEVSTPKSAWKLGEVPFLYQTDSAWANAEYAGATVKESGCGPTCLTMVYVALTGKTDRDPASMSAFSQLTGYVENGDTSWALMTHGAAKLGLSAQEVPGDVSSVKAELAAGHPVIASVGAGDFTTTGHFIVIAGVDEAGNFIVHDPNSSERSSVTWDAQRVINQCRGLWSYSV